MVMIKSIELNLPFNEIHEEVPTESAEIIVLEPLLHWLESEDSPLATNLAVGLCLITGVFLAGQLLRYLL